MSNHRIILGAAAIALAIAGAAEAQPSGRERITLYEGPNFTGRSFTADQDISNLPREYNDRAMSVRIVGSWKLCENSNYGGRCVDIDRDVSDLRSWGMDRTISSMRNTDSYGGGGGGGWNGGGGGRPPGGGWGGGSRQPSITFYEGPNFSGRSYSSDQDISNLPREYNDRAMSVRIRGSWRLCENSDYGGRCVDIDRDVSDLRSWGMDRTISSARNTDSYGGGGGWNGGGGGRPPGGGWRQPTITLYEGPNFSGRSITIDQDYTNLPREYNDRALSLRVQGSWQVCQDANYRGQCISVDRDVRDLDRMGLGQAISSLRYEGRDR